MSISCPTQDPATAGHRNDTYKCGQATTRYETASLLSACLDDVTEVTDELQRLMEGGKKEHAMLKGRVDGIFAKVGSLEAQQFSTTTKLKGEMNFILGGVFDFNSDSSGKQDRTTFNYDLDLNLDTSFTGMDLLRTRLRSDNFTTFSPCNAGNSLFKLDKASSTNSDALGVGSNNTVSIDRLYYQFPVGRQLTLTTGALVSNTIFALLFPAPTATAAPAHAPSMPTAQQAAGYWQPLDSGIIPSISAGYGFTNSSGGVARAADSQS